MHQFLPKKKTPPHCFFFHQKPPGNVWGVGSSGKVLGVWGGEWVVFGKVWGFFLVRFIASFGQVWGFGGKNGGLLVRFGGFFGNNSGWGFFSLNWVSTSLRSTPLTLALVFERLAVLGYDLQVSRMEPWKKGVVCFVVYNCTTKGGEKQCLYRGRIVAVQGDQVDVRWEADRQVKTHLGVDVHTSRLTARAALMKKDSARSPAKDVPQPASNEEVSDDKDKEATPASALVKIGRKQFPVSGVYGGRLKCDQETCDNLWTIC